MAESQRSVRRLFFAQRLWGLGDEGNFVRAMTKERNPCDKLKVRLLCCCVSYSKNGLQFVALSAITRGKKKVDPKPHRPLVRPFSRPCLVCVFISVEVYGL